jgi:phosphate transport system substrate-binding protein
MARASLFDIVRSGLVAACTAFLLAPATAAPSSEVTGAGSTFVYPVMAKWAATYYLKTGKAINYQAIGSGGGIQQVKSGMVTFGATDMPLRPDELQAAGLVQFPLVVGGVVPVVNLDGVGAGQVRLNGALLAAIFEGKIVNWSDPVIAQANPGLVFPNLKIVVVHRSDRSGTTFNWTDYLSKVSSEWKSSVGAGTTVKWPVGVGANGNEGVSLYIRSVKGSIGYVELSYALQRKLPYTALQNQAGVYVQPTHDSFSAAVASASWVPQQDFYQVVTNAPGANAWPIAGVVFVLMPRVPNGNGGRKDALAFFQWALREGQADAAIENYVALPPVVVEQVETYWGQSFK